MSFKVILLTPEDKLIEQDAQLVTIPGIDGCFSIMTNHSPIIAGIGVGKLSIKNNGKIMDFFIENGFLEMNNNVLSILADKVRLE